MKKISVRSKVLTIHHKEYRFSVTKSDDLDKGNFTGRVVLEAKFERAEE